MASDADISVELQQLHQKWDAITAVPEFPRSTMDVIEYGLGQQARAEVYINRMLCYLLDPSEPHQMGTRFLETFLQQLPDACGFDEDTYDLTDVRVNQQVMITESGDDGDEPHGFVDLVLDVPNEWFLLIELKFSAEETGTEFYCRASNLDGRPVETYESGQYYLYLHQQNQPQASCSCFTNWTWEAFVDDVLTVFLDEHSPRFPQRTVTQIRELRYDIRTITGMTDHDTPTQDKIELYLKHRDAIEDVRDTFDTAWENYTEEWGDDLASELDHDDIESRGTTQDGYPEVSVRRDGNASERWIFRDSGGDWQHLFKYGWRRHEETNEILLARADDRNDLRIGFYHRMGPNSNKDLAIDSRELKFNFRCMGSNPTAFNSIYDDCFGARTDDIQSLLANTNGRLTGNPLTKIEGTYDIPVSDHGDFFTAYTAALADAFTDLILMQPQLIQLLGQAFDEAIETYSGDT